MGFHLFFPQTFFGVLELFCWLKPKERLDLSELCCGKLSVYVSSVHYFPRFQVQLRSKDRSEPIGGNFKVFGQNGKLNKKLILTKLEQT